MNPLFRKVLEQLAEGVEGRVDLHTHTFLSDGDLLPMEHLRRCEAVGITCIGISDHVSFSNYKWVIESVTADCEVALTDMDILALPAVEITHVPPKRIPELAKLCLEAGAVYVVVHGESPVEPVKEGTNLASACEFVDVLAHPGHTTEEVVSACKEMGVSLEISARKGHNGGNPTVAKLGLAAGANLVVNTDAHTFTDYATLDEAKELAMDAGLSEERALGCLTDGVSFFAKRVLERADRMGY